VSLVPSSIIAILLFAATLYISLDTSQNWTNTFTLDDHVIAKTLFVLTLIWPTLYVFFLLLFILSSSSLILPLVAVAVAIKGIEVDADA
jgi:hypothetical protein